MLINNKFLIEKSAEIGNNIKIYTISRFSYKIFQSELSGSYAGFFNKKPILFLLITDGLVEVLSLYDGKKVMIKTPHDVSLGESKVISMESELNHV